MIPLGAEAKEHGPQLRLKNDFVLAEYYADRMMKASEVVVYPTMNYGFYPAFVDYPGSTTLRLATARDMIVDVIRTIARHGPKRFYVLNTGVSIPGARRLARGGLLLQPPTDRNRARDAAARARRDDAR